MNVVDSSGWLEYFAAETNADFFAEPISDPESLIVPAISIYEVFKRVLQQKDETEALEAIGFMLQGRLIELDASLSMMAAKLSLDMKLPMADSIILATAREFDATLWTQDEDFEGVEGVRYVRKTRKPA